MVQLTSPSSPPSSPSLLVRVSGLLVGLGSVAAGIALVRDAESAFGRTWASLFVVVGVIALLSFLTFLPGTARPRAEATDVVRDGEPARFHPHPAGRAEVVGTVVLVLLGGWFAVMGVVGALEETWIWAVVAVVPAAYFLGLPVLAALGRFRSGGWWSTPTRLVVEHRGLLSEVSWGDVGTVTPRSRSVHVSSTGAGAVRHRSLTPWPWRARSRSDDLVIPLPAGAAPTESQDLAAQLREAAGSAPHPR